ncbi:uncharacterized protein SPPG_05189 [Spizellomyces punctatus DAOM BR117]|uniref:DUF1990 domain-containing protein n=1 Tax=Spizellomyces punctatus (strain DAOM BR117) TaxID=645134 RepID=A0A0L0HFB0_SPIPD|nr:uncharacterized protein SPPG_05189 [Spizellomyces punctatus DAOM BR117]KNC99812.1 hypothetical protein SPPG_05189 [Spizellomyces punctatus DAOM BR117]|eukprot:XP_016607852.1 hypothetical protein SPPG_05189 [Spizellomyces punctatus DAOM BR117]
MTNNTIYILSACLLVPATGVLYLVHLHKKLSKKVTRKYLHVGEYDLTLGRPVNFPDAGTEPGTKVFTDCFEAKVPTKSLPPLGYKDLHTKFLRYNMARFSRMLQGYLLRLVNRDKADTEGYHYDSILNLDFKVGDLVMGTYRVTRRDDATGLVELGFEQDKHVAGVMVFRIERDDEFTSFSTQTVMWDPTDYSVARLPLSKPLVRYWHEVTAMWLIDTGIKHLQNRD